jgi:MFS transporter, DHA1 family, tetracycline resistance protein
MFEMPPYPKPPSAPQGAKLTVFLVVFIDLLGFGIVLPLLPRYAKDLLEPLGIERQLQGWVIGALLSIFSLMQFIFAPIWGRISDRVGRRPILLLGLGGSVVFYALFGYASTVADPMLALILMFAARSGAGIAGATIATAQAVIADVTPKTKRAHGMALIGVAFGIGFTFGPLIAGFAMWVLPDRPEFAGFFAAGLSAVALIVGLAKMPETLKPGESSYRRGWLDLHGMRSTFATPTVGLLILVFFLATFGFAKFEATLALLTKDFGYTDRGNFWVFAYVGFVLMLVQGGVYRRMKDKYHEVTLMRFGVGFMFAGLVALALVTVAPSGTAYREPGFYIALALGVTGFAFLTPSAQALISKRSDPTRQGEILGVNQSFSALARILGPLAGNVLFAMNHVLPYAVSAVLLVLVMGLLAKVHRD